MPFQPRPEFNISKNQSGDFKIAMDSRFHKPPTAKFGNKTYVQPWNDYTITANGEETQLPVKVGDKKGLKGVVRQSDGGKTWVDKSLLEWARNDYRIFIGDLHRDAQETDLEKVFGGYKSFLRAKVIHATKGDQRGSAYGFASFGKFEDMAHAIKHKQGARCNNRPITIRRSKWSERNVNSAKNIASKGKNKDPDAITGCTKKNSVGGDIYSFNGIF